MAKLYTCSVRQPGPFGAILWADTVEALDAAGARAKVRAAFTRPVEDVVYREAPEFARMVDEKRLAAMRDGFDIVVRPSKAKSR